MGIVTAAELRHTRGATLGSRLLQLAVLLPPHAVCSLQSVCTPRYRVMMTTLELQMASER